MITLVAYSRKAGVYRWSLKDEHALDTCLYILDDANISWLVIY